MCRSTSWPSSFGRRMSSRIRPGRGGGTGPPYCPRCSRKSTASWPSFTQKIWFSTLPSRNVRMVKAAWSALSSTSRMSVGLRFSMAISPALAARPDEVHGRSLAARGLDPDPPARALHDLLHDRQPDPRPGRLDVGEPLEQLEDLLVVRGVDADPVVPHQALHPFG